MHFGWFQKDLIYASGAVRHLALRYLELDVKVYVFKSVIPRPRIHFEKMKFNDKDSVTIHCI